MVRLGKLAMMISVALALLAAAVGTHAQTASALVLETSGASVPAMQPYTEIPVNATVSLAPGAKLVFLHYHTCRTVGVVGGTIMFSAEAYTLTGGTKQLDVRSPCPGAVKLKTGGEVEVQVAGTLLRGGRFTLPLQPAFVLVGVRAGDFASVRVSQEGQAVLEAPLDGRRFRWPAEAAPLVVDTEYELALVPTVAGGVPLTIRFKATAPASPPAGEALVLINVE